MPNSSRSILPRLFAGVLALTPMLAMSAQTQPPEKTAAASERRDGARDFDFEIGTWNTRLKRLVHPLSGSDEWAEYTGTTIVSKVWNGRANLVELVADGPAGHFEGASLRLYNPESRQWSLNFANARSGTLSLPTIGEFKDGRGVFFNQDSLDGRAILVRFLIIPIDARTIRFEQAYSDDIGKTWETNWIAIDTKVD
jgi:hypothetical protein